MKKKYINIISRKNITGVTQEYKVLIVVAKKTIKQAVKRNKIKRRIAAIISEAKIKNTFSIIIQIHNRNIVELNYTELQTEINTNIETFK